MAFERIKTVKGKQYKYLVENIRENGKVKQKIVKYLGRVDNDKTGIQAVTLPYGVYYFSQDGCAGCSSEDEIKAYIKPYKSFQGVDLPDIQYINISDRSPALLDIHLTPVIIDIGSHGVSAWMSIWNWLEWKLGDRYEAVNEAVRKARYEQKPKKKNKKCKDGACPVPSSSANISTT